MKTNFVWILAATLSVGMLAAFTSSTLSRVKHVVVFKYKASATPAQITEVTEAFKALKAKIPGIVSFEYGTNNSPEGFNKGFTHAYLLTFESEAARNAYLPHPEHKKFGDLLGRLGVLEEPFVVDFLVNEVK